MKKILIVAIVDQSGSMESKVEDTIGGINTTIKELKNDKLESEEILFSLKFFNHSEFLKIRNVRIEDVRPLKNEDMKPKGSTSLYDAIGNTLHYFITEKLKDSTYFDSLQIFISTDGLENSSKKYNSNSIKNMIEYCKHFNITLVYLGANQNAILEAAKIGITQDSALNYDETKETVDSAWRSVARGSKRTRTDGSAFQFLQAERVASQV